MTEGIKRIIYEYTDENSYISVERLIDLAYVEFKADRKEVHTILHELKGEVEYPVLGAVKLTHYDLEESETIEAIKNRNRMLIFLCSMSDGRYPKDELPLDEMNPEFREIGIGETMAMMILAQLQARGYISLDDYKIKVNF